MTVVLPSEAPTMAEREAAIVAAYSRLSWITLDAVATELGRPTEGRIAEAIWRKSNDPSISVYEVIELLPRMGYLPFQGYPLKLNGPRPPDLEARHQALEAAYEEARRNYP
jgi:hypothetical protein